MQVSINETRCDQALAQVVVYRPLPLLGGHHGRDDALGANDDNLISLNVQRLQAVALQDITPPYARLPPRAEGVRRLIDRGHDRQSALAPLSLTTVSYLASSACIKRPNASGVLGTGSAIRVANRDLVSSCCRA